MKSGFTTGTCAAAAAKAATIMLFEKAEIDRVSLYTPAGREFTAEISDIMLTKTGSGINSVKCAVKKPESDDPDVTAGMMIYALAEFSESAHTDYVNQIAKVIIEGGEGIGKVTKPGLDQPVGEYAINSVPRKMIEQEVLAVAEEYEYTGTIRIVISAPEGEKIAGKTFNSRLGIEGGISIIGTSGLVEPMSTKAIIDTIRIELRQQRELGASTAVVSPGNYGLDFMKAHYGYDLDKAVKCSNYIGETIDIARDLGFTQMLLVGHMGKLVTVSGGIMNTHSALGDHRMELMAEAAGSAGAGRDTIEKILSCVSTDEAYACMLDAHIERECFDLIMSKIMHYLEERADTMTIGCIVYSNKYGVVGASEGAEEKLKECT